MKFPYHQIIMAEVLRTYRNKSICFFPNSGNAGDALINVGSMHAFSRNSIRYELIGADSNVENKVVFLGGGGNFIPDYATIRNAFQRFLGKAKEIILLPHTVRGNEDILELMGSNVTLICRDVESYQHAIRTTKSALVLLGHDMAFHVDTERLLGSSESGPVYQPSFLNALEKHKINLEYLQKKDKVYYARHDVERAGSIGGSDADISEIFSFGTWPGNAERSAWALLEMIRCSPPIVTDRLHVGIGSAILGKKCDLHDNSYGKNAGVWRHSLRHHFPHIQFMARD